jgi:hypothetical protein
MRHSTLAAAALCAGLWLAPQAAAQQATGEFGGGAVSRSSEPPFEAGNMAIGLRTSADGASVQVDATIVGRCASGTFTATAPVAADGSFRATGAVRQARTITRYELRGVLSNTPAGTLTASFERATNKGNRRCSARDVVWDARRPAAGFGDTTAIPPGGLLFGSSAQRDRDGTPLGVALRLSADGRSLSRAFYGVRSSCSNAGTSPTFDLPHDDLAIGPDGRVSDREEGTVRTQTSILKYVERFAATVGSAGAEGMYSVELSLRRRATGKRVTRCRSGVVRWSASY